MMEKSVRKMSVNLKSQNAKMKKIECVFRRSITLPESIALSYEKEIELAFKILMGAFHDCLMKSTVNNGERYLARQYLRQDLIPHAEMLGINSEYVHRVVNEHNICGE